MPAQTHKSGRRQEQKARTREAVIVAARELFHHHGYDAVTIRQVAKAAKVSTGAIFPRFDGKDALFEAAMGEKAPDVEAFMHKIIAVDLTATTYAERGTALRELAIEAERLRRCLHGNHA